MKKKLLTGIIVCCSLIGISSISQAVVIQSEPIQTNPLSTENLWGYSYLPNDSNIYSAHNYWATASSQYTSATHQGYITGDFGPGSPGVDSFSSNNGTSNLWDSRTTHIFETYIKSSINQTITLRMGGDDGHSIFLDDTFYHGAGYAHTALTNFTMSANTSYKLSAVLHNYSGPWSGWLSLQEAGQTGSSPVSEAFNISMNATGDFAPNAVPEPASMLIFGTGLVGLVGSRLRKKKK